MSQLESLQEDKDLLQGLDDLQKQETDQIQKGKAEEPTKNDEKTTDDDSSNSWMAYAVVGAAIVVAGASYLMKKK